MRILSASIADTSSLRPATYIDDVLLVGKVVGSYVEMTYPDYQELVMKYNPATVSFDTGHVPMPFTSSPVSQSFNPPPL